jgi:hypothetical protein
LICGLIFINFGKNNNMDPLTAITVATQVLPALYKSGLGLKQAMTAGKTPTQPFMEIPEGITDMVTMVENMAGQRQMPGRSIMSDVLEADAAKASSDIMRASGGTASSLGAIADVFEGKAAEERKLNIADSQYYQSNQKALADALQILGGWQQKQFMTNEMDPYMAASKEHQALKAGSAQNLYGALTDIAKVTGGAYNSGFLEELFGREGDPGEPTLFDMGVDPIPDLSGEDKQSAFANMMQEMANVGTGTGRSMKDASFVAPTTTSQNTGLNTPIPLLQDDFSDNPMSDIMKTLESVNSLLNPITMKNMGPHTPVDITKTQPMGENPLQNILDLIGGANNTPGYDFNYLDFSFNGSN